MKGKKNRKLLSELVPSCSLKPRDTSALFKVKFQISNDNISCFMGAKRRGKRLPSKPSKSVNKGRKSLLKAPSLKSKPQVMKILAAEAQREGSPDIIREASNTILSKIQQNGIDCNWQDNDGCEEGKQEMGDQSSHASLWSAFDNDFSKSFASTNDFHHYHTVTANFEWAPPDKVVNYSNSFGIVAETIMHDWRTTIMIRNIPNKYTINELSFEIDAEHANTYDFLYLPCDLKNQCNVGYGFINFVSTEHLLSFYKKFNRYVWKKYKSEKICALTYARLQGLTELIEHFQNSKVLNQKQKKYRPIIKLDKIHKMVLQQQGRNSQI